jgi:hypothetical protein
MSEDAVPDRRGNRKLGVAMRVGFQEGLFLHDVIYYVVGGGLEFDLSVGAFHYG